MDKFSFHWETRILNILKYDALRNFFQATKKFRTPFKLSPYQVPCIKSFKNFGNRLIIEKPKTKHLLESNLVVEQSKEWLLLSWLNRWKWWLTMLSVVVELFLLKNLLESFINPCHQLGDFLKINSCIRHSNQKLFH